MNQATITFGGDVLLGGYYESPIFGTMDRLTTRIESLATIGGASAVADELFKNISSLVRDSDLSVVNLEGPITPELTPDQLATKLADKMFPLRQHEATPAILQQAGIDLVSLANNHTFDYDRQQGLQMTMEKLTGLVDYVGVGVGEQAYEPVIKQINGLKIAFFGVTDLLDPEDMCAREGVLGVAGIPEIEDFSNSETLKLLCRKIELAEQNVDFTIVLLHAGPIKGAEVSKPQEQLVDRLLDAGVDVIAGAHSHSKQPVLKIFNRQSQIQQIAFYGLGNLIFGGRQGTQAVSMLATVTLIKDNHNEKYLEYLTRDIFPNPDTTFTPVLVDNH